MPRSASAQERLGLYSRYIAEHGPKILAAFPGTRRERLRLGRLGSTVHGDDRGPLRRRHRLQLRTLDPAQHRPRPVAAGRLFFSAPSKLRADSMASVHRRLRSAAASTSSCCAPPCRSPISRCRSGICRAMPERFWNGLNACCAMRPMRPRVPRSRCHRGRLLPRSQRIHGRPMADGRRQHRALRRRAAEQPGRASMPTPCCIASPTSTTCSARRSRIFMSPPGSTTRPACSCSASCRAVRSGITIRPSASITSARSPY